MARPTFLSSAGRAQRKARKNKSMKKCIFAGSFDPPTVGHLDTIAQAAKIFDEVVVAILVNPQKQPLFTVEERKELLRLLCEEGDVKNARVIEWSDVVVRLLQKENTPFYVRGIRNTIDFEYENMAHYASRKLDENIITIYLPARQEHLQISSTLVKNSIRFNTPYEEYVGERVAEKMKEILKKRG